MLSLMALLTVLVGNATNFVKKSNLMAIYAFG